MTEKRFFYVAVNIYSICLPQLCLTEPEWPLTRGSLIRSHLQGFTTLVSALTGWFWRKFAVKMFGTLGFRTCSLQSPAAPAPPPSSAQTP